MQPKWFSHRNTTALPVQFIQWDGYDLQGLRDWLEVWRPTPSWVIRADGTGDVVIVHGSVDVAGGLPFYWLQLAAWDETGSPVILSDYDLHYSYQELTL